MSKTYDRIRAIRIAKNLKQEEVAQRLSMAQSNYARMEKGLTQITVDRLEQLAEVFEMTVSSILNYETGQQLTSEDITYYINYCKKLEKEIEKYKKQISDLEENELESWSRKDNEIKAVKSKNKDLIEKIKVKDAIIESKIKEIDKLDRHIQTLDNVVETLRVSIELNNLNKK
ncbi:helix-turn-helix domain-containing protein [Spirosoma radiotolerans]|uniref:HTH cro/C1-type domain-containing protein n=1 Tax=Spirosoma radiotolerans TaxID=1379870 RepID=A0A0E3ZYS3_9BACT|nr:helix-turn-helix transcriptional regulator [Spirosoma radiotolerans]AKD56983.1 hypothetical protein SD10_20835 [Spirosoma radiotolerans]